MPSASSSATPPWLRRNRWLLARRTMQLAVLAAFMLGPWAGVWVGRGTLASSEWFGVLWLTDPFVALQSLFAGHTPEGTVLAGAALVAGTYLLLGGRSYCAWICPINPVTDLAAWLRRRLRLPALLNGARPDRRLRAVVLGVALGLSAVLGGVAWEMLNPITLLQRAIVLGLAGGYGVGLGVFLFDLLVLPRGWCGHLCPVGAFYAALGRATPLHISAVRRQDCTTCGDCFKVCPEPHVIAPALYGAAKGLPPEVQSADCTRCGRCIDHCDEDVFEFVLKLPGRRAK